MQEISTYKNKLIHRLNCVKDVNEYNQRVAQLLSKQLDLPDQLFKVKLNFSSQLPEKIMDYYYRAVSILKKLIENPCGLKTLRRMYSRMKRGVSKPPKRVKASAYALNVILRSLCSKGYLFNKSNLGYYTTLKGKELLNSML